LGEKGKGELFHDTEKILDLKKRSASFSPGKLLRQQDTEKGETPPAAEKESPGRKGVVTQRHLQEKGPPPGPVKKGRLLSVGEKLLLVGKKTKNGKKGTRHLRMKKGNFNLKGGPYQRVGK